MKNVRPARRAVAVAFWIALQAQACAEKPGSSTPAGGADGSADRSAAVPASAGGIDGAAGGAGGAGGVGSDGGGSGGGGGRDSAAGEPPVEAPADAAPSRGRDAGGADRASDAVTASAPSAIPAEGLGPWTGDDDVPPSRNPPGNFPPEKVPMFVGLGFDDNPSSEAVQWVLSVFSDLKNPAGTGNPRTYDGTPARATFYHTSQFAGAAQGSWKAAHQAGFETGNHTTNHRHGGTDGENFNQSSWSQEIAGCNATLTGAVGVPAIHGFRTPFLEYNGNVFPAIKAAGFWYDCSIQEGTDPDQDGTDFVWPYTLDRGSPGHATDDRLAPIRAWPAGLWEMPVYRVLIPGDADAARYGLPPGLRARLAAMKRTFTEANPKISGLDYNLWNYGLSRAEFAATLKHSLDLRRRGNRAPFLFGMHSALYTSEPLPGASIADRRRAVVEFLHYAISLPDVRVVTTKAVLDWIRNPVPLP
jgi:hypothetical protein